MSAEVILDEHSGMYKADGYFYPRVTSILAAGAVGLFRRPRGSSRVRVRARDVRSFCASYARPRDA